MEIEAIPGFHTALLHADIIKFVLEQPPAKYQFDLLGYTQVVGHRFSSSGTKGLNIDKLKEIVMKNTFTLFSVAGKQISIIRKLNVVNLYFSFPGSYTRLHNQVMIKLPFFLI